MPGVTDAALAAIAAGWPALSMLEVTASGCAAGLTAFLAPPPPPSAEPQSIGPARLRPPTRAPRTAASESLRRLQLLECRLDAAEWSRVLLCAERRRQLSFLSLQSPKGLTDASMEDFVQQLAAEASSADAGAVCTASGDHRSDDDVQMHPLVCPRRVPWLFVDNPPFANDPLGAFDRSRWLNADSYFAQESTTVARH